MASFNRRKPRSNVTPFPRPARTPRPVPIVAADKPPPRRRRGIYLLPNACTTGALFAGFSAIVQSMNQRFDVAVILIFVAAVLDSLDGRIARLTNTQSEFGAQYDSLSDMVAFGVAPGLVVYEWSLLRLDKWGWIGAFVYVAAAALRLARFNTNIAVVDKRFFQGLPSPAAAGLVAGFVWAANDLHYSGAELAIEAWILTVFAGLSMVSNSPFYSFKAFNLRKSVPFVFAILIMLTYVVISSASPTVLWGVIFAYGLSGHVFWCYRRIRRGRGGVAPKPPAPS